MAINLKFGLFWSGAKLSYLRYLTFKSLRHYHPDAEIELFVSDKYKSAGHKWGCEKQDFEQDDIGKDYIEELSNLNIKIRKLNAFGNYAPNYQSDMMRWWYVNSYSGFYLDTDQIILRSFSELPKEALEANFIYSGYPAKSCGYYTPVGVIGGHNSELVRFIMDVLPNNVNENNYNSAGPFLLRAVLEHKPFNDVMFNAPSDYFYPISESIWVDKIYDGSFKIPEESFALHWYGGSPVSQEFNKKYTEEFAKTSNDTLSKFLREKGII